MMGADRLLCHLPAWRVRSGGLPLAKATGGFPVQTVTGQLEQGFIAEFHPEQMARAVGLPLDIRQAVIRDGGLKTTRVIFPDDAVLPEFFPLRIVDELMPGGGTFPFINVICKRGDQPRRVSPRNVLLVS